MIGISGTDYEPPAPDRKATEEALKLEDEIPLYYLMKGISYYWQSLPADVYSASVIQFHGNTFSLHFLV